MNINRLSLLVACVVPAASVLGGVSRCGDGDEGKARGGEQRSAEPKAEQARSNGRGPGRWWESSEEEKQAAMKFFQDHSPRRWSAFATLPDAEKKKVMGSMFGRYKMMQFISKDPPLHANKLRQIELEDEIFGMRMDLQNAGAEEGAKMRESIRERVRELVERRLEERAMRIGWLEKNVQQEKDKLAADQQRKDELVEAALREELERRPTVGPDEGRRAGQGR